MTVQRPTQHFAPAIARSSAAIFAPIQREFDRLVDQFGDGWANLTQFEILPSMDVRNTKDGFELSFELPGIDAKDVKIDVEDDVLTVSGEKKSQTAVGSFKLVAGLRFCVWMKSGNFSGSRMKNTGVLLPTMSQLPSSVYSFSAKPRGSRAASALPFSPPTVENRRKHGVFLPISWNGAALVR